MRRSPQLIGGTLGVLAALVVLAGLSRRPQPMGPMLSECGGPFRELVIHYVAGDTIAWPVYAQFLPQLAEDVTVYVVCPDRGSFDELLGRVGAVSCRLSPLVVDHPVTVWSRDRWIALAPAPGSGRIALLTAAEESGSEIWPQRAGDAKVAADIARELGESVVSDMLPLAFDGGDLLADEFNVFVTPSVSKKNASSGYRDVNALQELLSDRLGKPAVILKNAPNHHAGMYMMAAGQRTMLVGDPRMAISLYDSSLPYVPEGADLTEPTQHQFDAVAEQLSGLGYRVVRIPVLPSTNGKAYLTYVNVITEQRDGKKIVYMPTYPQAPEMNALAAQIWEGLGYEVHPIDCSSCYADFGTLHCLVNVLRRG